MALNVLLCNFPDVMHYQGLIATNLICGGAAAHSTLSSKTACLLPHCSSSSTFDRLDALEFKPGRSHKKALNRSRFFNLSVSFLTSRRWNRFVLEGSASEEMDVDDTKTKYAS